MPCIFLLLLAFFLPESCQIEVTGQHDLELHLCESRFLSNKNTTLVLSTDITHIISKKSFCLINTTYSVTIASDSSTVPATIRCSNGSSPTTGFVFINLHNLTLQRLIFIDCGAYLMTLDNDILSIINSSNSTIYFKQYRSAALLFVDVNAISIIQLFIPSSLGFGLLFFNSVYVFVEDLTINSSESAHYYQKSNHSIGSGIFFMFTDDLNLKTSLSPRVVIQESVISGNFDHDDSANCVCDIWKKGPYFPAMNAAGLTIIYSQIRYLVSVLLANSIFCHNSNSAVGAMLVFAYKSTSNTTIKNCKFTKNFNQNKCRGSSLVYYTSSNSQENFLTVRNCSFSKHDTLSNTKKLFGSMVFVGAFSAEASVTVKFIDVSFNNNQIDSAGSCLSVAEHSHLHNSNIKVVFQNVIAHENSIPSSFSKAEVFSIINIKSLHITGLSNSFCHNYGSVFKVTNTIVHLGGRILFQNNKGERGSAFKLYANSVFYLENGLIATFINNRAQTKGGAIYADGTYYERSNDFFHRCTFQSAVTLNNISLLNINMSFINNSAEESGSSIFSTNIYNCYINNHHFNTSQATRYYHEIFHFVSSATVNNLSTVPERQCYCINDSCIPSKIVQNKSTYVYPGQAFHIPLAAENVNNDRSHSNIALAITNSKYQRISSVYISSDNTNRIIKESQNCTVVTVTVQWRNEVNVNPYLVVTSPFDTSLLALNLHLLHCPLGFVLNYRTATCECSQIINMLGQVGQYQPVCKIHTAGNHYSSNSLVTITRPPDSAAWAGMINHFNNNTFGVALTCYKYCNLNIDYTSFVVSGTNISIANPNDLNNTNSFIPICPVSREGPLCSICSVVDGERYSVVFGSTDCKYCSNWWLLTIFFYIIAGPAIIYVLYVLKLTLTTGTLNGIIFYTQVIIVMDTKFPASQNECSLRIIFTVCKIFISLLNLNLGFPLCFYNGMTELWKAGLNLVFPVYLLAIVVILIIVSHFSVKLSNKISHSSVQVLVTVVHLSFSRLLGTTMDVFTPINIYMYLNTTVIPLKVWYSDATIEYGKDGHLILMVITASIVGPILLTYLTILIAGRPLQRCYKLGEYIRPIYEAIHAPYEHNKEFFFSLRVLLVALLYILYAMFRGGDIYKGISIAIPLLSIVSLIDGFSRPFRHLWMNVLNLFVLSIINLIVGTLWYCFKVNSIICSITILSATTSVILLIFIAIVFCHILWVTGQLKKISFVLFSLKMKLQLKLVKKSSPNVPNLEIADSFFEPCDKSREPLLSPS